MNRFIFGKLLCAGVLVAVALLTGAKTSRATNANFSISVDAPGCTYASGTVTFNNIPPSAAIEVDAAIISGGVYNRWSGSPAAGQSGTQTFGFGWQPPSPVPDGTQIALQIWVWDINTFGYIRDPATNSPVWYELDYACTNTITTSNVAQREIYPPDTRVMGLIKVDTPLYAMPDKTSPVVGTLTAGQTWFLVGTAHNATWYQVFVGGPQLAWVQASAVAPMGTVPRGKTQPKQ